MAEPVPPNPTAETFLKTWVRPRDALAMFSSISVGICIREIAIRLREGMLYAAGSPSASKASGINDPRMIVLPNQWPATDFWLSPDNSLWITGRIRLAMGSGNREYEYFGTRLDPDGLQRMADEVGVSIAISTTARLAHALAEAVRAFPTSPPNPKNVPETGAIDVAGTEIDAWYRSLSSEERGLGLAKLWAKAKADHAPRKVVRKLVEPFVQGRKTGRKPVIR